MVLEAQGTFSPCSFCEQSALQAFQGQRTRSLQTVRREGVRLPAGPGSLQSGKGARLGRAPLYPVCKGQSQHLPGGGLGSLRGALRAPGRWLVGAVVLVLVRRPLGLRRHHEGLALRHEGLCPSQQHS